MAVDLPLYGVPANCCHTRQKFPGEAEDNEALHPSTARPPNRLRPLGRAIGGLCLVGIDLTSPAVSACANLPTRKTMAGFPLPSAAGPGFSVNPIALRKTHEARPWGGGTDKPGGRQWLGARPARRLCYCCSSGQRWPEHREQSRDFRFARRPCAQPCRLNGWCPGWGWPIEAPTRPTRSLPGPV